MRAVWSVLRLAGRAALWRITSDPPLVGLPAMLGSALALGAVQLALQYLGLVPWPPMTPQDINALVASLAIGLAVAALFLPVASRTTALTVMMLLSLPVGLIGSAASDSLVLKLPIATGTGLWRDASIAAVALALTIWWIGAMVAVLRSFAPQPAFRALGRIAALWLCGLVAAALPIAAAHDAADQLIGGIYLHERSPTPSEDRADPPLEPVRLDQSQRDLLQAEISQLSPPKKGATNVYAIGIAGWADQDVFIKELDGALAVLGGVLPIRGHTLRLVNHRETLESLPLANQRNFAAAVHAVAALMDKNEDVLLLLMTSHGEPSGFGLRLPNALTSELTPREVAAALDHEGVKNRVVIVSACFSGVFVPPLANDDTIVLTAADARSTSFGCTAEREWTYFGDAFFRQSLRPGMDLRRAFDNARVLIQGWELMDRVRPSNPQGHFGPALVSRLAPFFSAQ